ncbi:DUF4153 domain-containing protein [Sphingomonas aerophila]|uniref:DUF4173 domain-containing protein n=1 Tax=Sphingomonas aerophila TaxID=1344948 RepID=A0A7W9ETX6_9SPHN|nr:DUF4173 domain-containing protein [Sphingomonas aerophila]MBB5714560.1 hypothetical protein [Sphingomonas aerophila]
MTRTQPRRQYSFIAKVLAAAALIGMADLLLYGRSPGAAIGAFAIAWAGALALVRPVVRRRLASRISLAGAASFAVIVFDDPSFLGSCLFWMAIASATLLPQHRFNDAISWGGRLIRHAIIGIASPLRDLNRLTIVGRQSDRASVRAVLALLALPVVGGGVFLALFANANPLISDAFRAIRFPGLWSAVAHLAFWLAMSLIIWPNFRPRNTVSSRRSMVAGIAPSAPDLPLATLKLSLLTFNVIFAVQNGLDLAFLWSGAALPSGVTLADYAHSGAYLLIVTALLAGAFVLVASRPGSLGSESTMVRRLLVAWIAQNLLLVASSALRTLDYIDAYSLTRLRIAALAWMALVGIGLVLIGWRMLRGGSARWLINANAVTAGVVLTASSIVDYGAVAAAWNIRHARTAADLDLCYLHGLGSSSLLPLMELERRAQGPVLRDQAAFIRSRIMADLSRDQSDWHSWTWRNARRLTAARRVIGSAPRQPSAAPHGRTCAGAVNMR